MLEVCAILNILIYGTDIELLSDDM